jgi:hypothetical protein
MLGFLDVLPADRVVPSARQGLLGGPDDGSDMQEEGGGDDGTSLLSQLMAPPRAGALSFSYQPDFAQPPQSVRAGDYGGALERIARAQLGQDAAQHDINNYVGQLFELNGIRDARAIQPEQRIVLPDAGTPVATRGLAQYGDDIAVGLRRQAAAAPADAPAPTPAGGLLVDPATGLPSFA